MATTTPKEFALAVDSDGRTVRKFLRSITPVEDRPGKGSRWEIENRKINSLKKQFQKWDAERQAAAEEAADEAEIDES